MSKKSAAPHRGVRAGEHQISAVLPPGYITESEAARRYGINVDRLRKLLRPYEHAIKVVRVPTVLVDVAVLDRAMEEEEDGRD